MYVKSQRVTSAISSSSLIPLRIAGVPMKNTTTATIKAMMVMPTIQKSHCPVVRGVCWAEFVQGEIKMTTIPAPWATMPTMEHNVKTQSGARRTRAKAPWNLRRIAATSIKRKIIDMLQKIVEAARSILDMVSETETFGSFWGLL